jgi:TRAP-type C4-dicarboxylate transport system substrate-binding protein
MLRTIVPSTVLAMVLALVLPGSSEIGKAQQTQTIKIAMLSPRGGTIHQAFKKLSDYIVRETKNAAELRIYPTGVAGDEVDAIRKMQLGQMDGAMVTGVGLALIEPQVSVLDAPGAVKDFAAMDLVLKEMKKDLEDLLAKKGVQYLFSVPDGRYRYFSKGPLLHISDLKTHRFWLWPASYIIKEILREAGATGVPLGANDVFGALQTGIIDALIATPPSLVAMRWHSKLDHVSASSNGVLEFHLIINKKKWDALPKNVKDSINNHIPEARKDADRGLKADLDTLNKLIARGYTETKVSPKVQAEWDSFFERVRKRLVGRVFPAALLQKVMNIASKAKS